MKTYIVKDKQSDSMNELLKFEQIKGVKMQFSHISEAHQFGYNLCKYLDCPVNVTGLKGKTSFTFLNENSILAKTLQIKKAKEKNKIQTIKSKIK